MQPWQVVDFDGCLYYAFVATDSLVQTNDHVTKSCEIEYPPKQLERKDVCIKQEVVEKSILNIKSKQLNSTESLSNANIEYIDEENNKLEIEQSRTADEEEGFQDGRVFEVINKSNDEGNDDDVEECIIEALDEYYVIKVKSESANVKRINENESKNDIYICQICNACFPLKDMLERHQCDVHDLDVIDVTDKLLNQQYQCKICLKICHSFNSLKMHTDTEHKGEEACIQEMNVETNLKYTCTFCSYESTNKSTLQSHISRKHSKRKSNNNEKIDTPNEFGCDVCEFKCQNKRRLKEHLERRHASEYKYECEFCEKKFKVKGDMRLHVRFKHKESPIVCDVCGKTCSNSNSLYVHQKWAHFKPKFECDICKRRMVTQENLDQHILLQHERRERFVCEECGKPFQENHRLKQHMMTHTGDRPYDCHICGKAFARRTAYRQHLLIHTGQRPYVCDICGKSFTQKPGLICHRKSHPGIHPPLPVVHIDHILNDFMKKD